MTRGHRPPIALGDYKAQKMDEGATPVVDENGVTHLIPPPAMWSDAAVDAATAGDVVAASKALLGDDGYTSFVEGGGSAALLMSIIEDEQGATPGE